MPKVYLLLRPISIVAIPYKLKIDERCNENI